jgi:hypothetical protein
MLARLDSLIAVLRLAQQKASDAQSTRPNEAARIDKMHGDLSKTLDVCDTARRALRARPPRGSVPLASSDGQPIEPTVARGEEVDSRPGCFAESSSLEEFERLCGLAPLSESKLDAKELDQLCAQLTKLDEDVT